MLFVRYVQENFTLRLIYGIMLYLNLSQQADNKNWFRYKIRATLLQMFDANFEVW